MVQWLKGISSRILLQDHPRLRRQFWAGTRAQGYMAVSGGTVIEEAIRACIEEQEGEGLVDDSRFQIDPPSNPPA